MSIKVNTLPADTDRPCNCCGRTHRKLYLYRGYWMGKTCIEHFELYEMFHNSTLLANDKHFQAIAIKVKNMITAQIAA